MHEIAEQLASRLEADPNDVQAYEALKQHYLRTQDLASLTNLIARWAAYQTDPYRASRGYYDASRVIAKAEPDHERRLALLRKAVALDTSYRSALQDLMELLPRIRDQQTLAGFLEEHLQTMETRDGDKQVMASLYGQLAELWDQSLRHPEAAQRCYERVLDLTPTPAEAADPPQSTARARTDGSLLVRALKIKANHEPDRTRRAERYRAQAKLLAREPAAWDQVVNILQSAHNLSPGNTQLTSEPADAYAQRAGSRGDGFASEDRRHATALRCQVARNLSPADALPLLRAALQTQPDSDEALQLLEQYATTLGQTTLLPQFWLAYIERAPPGLALDRRRIELTCAYERAGRPDDASACLEHVRDASLAADRLTQLRVSEGKQSPPLSPRPPHLAWGGGAAGRRKHENREPAREGGPWC